MKNYTTNKMLYQIMDAMNLNVSEIAKFTGWEDKKIIKILNKEEVLTISEIKVLSKCLNLPSSVFFNHDNPISEMLKIAGELYASPERGNFSGSKVGKLIKKLLPGMIMKKLNFEESHYKVEGSIGKGQYAEIAWIALFDTKITNTATRGIYLVFLYSADGKSLYLSLNQGYTYFKEKFKSDKAREEIKKMAHIIRNNISYEISDYISSIDLNATKSLGKGYEAGHILGIKYELDNMPEDKYIIKDLLDLLSIYKFSLSLFSERSIEDFYDFLVAEEKGLINLQTIETEINTSNAPKIDQIKIIDEPRKKQKAIIDSQGIRHFPRDPTVAANALAEGKFLCAYDDSHFTFISKKSEHMYVEAHHLIPISLSDNFDNSLDVEANVIPLCSICHDCIHHGTNDDRTKLLKKLYHKRKDRLEKAGISISFEQLLLFYDIKQ